MAGILCKKWRAHSGLAVRLVLLAWIGLGGFGIASLGTSCLFAADEHFGIPQVKAINEQVGAGWGVVPSCVSGCGRPNSNGR